MDWFKTYQDGILRGSLSGADDVTQLIWVKLLAVENETRLRDGWLHFAPGRPMTHEYLAAVCRVSVAQLEWALIEFSSDMDSEGHPRIEIADDGDIFIKNWQKYQAKPAKVIEVEVAKEKNRQARMSLAAVTQALTRRVNELNMRLALKRYELTPEGRVFDTATGKDMSPEEFSRKEAESSTKERGEK